MLSGPQTDSPSPAQRSVGAGAQKANPYQSLLSGQTAAAVARIKID